MVSWPLLSPLGGWGSLTMAFTSKFVYIYIYIYLNQTEIGVYGAQQAQSEKHNTYVVKP